MAFLHSCIRERLPLKSLRRKPMVDSIECQQAIYQFQHRTTRALINDQHRRVRDLKLGIDDCRGQCEATLSRHHLQVLISHIREMEQRTRRETATRLQCKMSALREFKHKHCILDGLVRNLSSKVFTRSQLSLLQRDIGHNLMDANALDFITALEPAMRKMVADEEVKSSIRQQVTGLLTSHRYHHTLSKEETMALNQLKRDDSIVILPADKGRMTVVMDKSLYVTKALDLLNDRTAYRVIEKDPSVMLRNRTNKLLDNLKRSNKIREDTLRRIRPCDTALARFYGLPKVHKEGIPLRPIVSFVGTPISGLAKWLSVRLCHLVEGSPTTIKSAEEFLNKIRTLRLEDDERMVSFDVTSLFTSIPQDLAISALGECLTNIEGSYHQDSLQKDDLLKLVRICLTTYFTFQGTIYEQTKGTPMGSPISSIIAEVVLQQLERKAMAIYQPKFWVRYVDDTFAVVKKQHVATFMEILNSICLDIQFTVEEEKQGHLAFLDVSVYRQSDGQLHTGVFRKSTYTDRILHCKSNHPVSHKISCIKTLFKRVDSHCSTQELKRAERKHLYRTCQRNGYPWRLVRRYSTMPHPRRNQRRDEPPLQKTRIALPYIHDVSEATARLLAPYGVEIAHKPNQTLRSKVVRPKDPLATMDKSAVIYKIECKNCDGNYVGETSKRLRTRLHEHKLAIKRGEQRSQLWTHMAQLNHQFDFANTRIMSEENTKEGRLLKEAWYSDKDSINRHVDLHPAQLALRRWDSNLQHNRCKWSEQSTYNYDCKTTSIPPHGLAQEHPLPSDSHPLMCALPPQPRHDESPPLKCEDNHEKLGAISKKCRRSTAHGNNDHGNNGHVIGEKKQVNKNGGATQGFFGDLWEKEVTYCSDGSSPVHTIVCNSALTPWNGDSETTAIGRNDQLLLKAIEIGRMKETRVDSKKGYGEGIGGNAAKKNGETARKIGYNLRKRESRVLNALPTKCVKVSDPPPQNSNSVSIESSKNDRRLLKAMETGGVKGIGGGGGENTWVSAWRGEIRPNLACNATHSKSEKDRARIEVNTHSYCKPIGQRVEMSLENLNDEGGSTYIHTHTDITNGTPNIRDMEERTEATSGREETQGKDHSSIGGYPGDTGVIGTPIENRTRVNTMGERKRDPVGVKTDKNTTKRTTLRRVKCNEETSRTQVNRLGPVTRSMSRVQTSAKPI